MHRYFVRWSVVCLFLSGIGTLWAQEQRPTIWEERAKERFTRVTSIEKIRISQAQPQDSGLRKKQLKRIRRILVFYRCEGFIHTSIPWGNFALQEMARRARAFSVDLEDDYEVFNKRNLSRYHAILFNNSSELKFQNDRQRKAIVDFVRGGGGVIGIHGASDSFYDWKEGAAIIGGQFNGHPWTANGEWAFKLDDPTHPLNRAFGGRGFWHQDEIYQYDPSTFQGLDNLRILVSLDMSKPKMVEQMNLEKYADYNAKYGSQDRQVPVSWIGEVGKGRVFYTNFGHREETYENPAIMRHIFDGILYAVGFTDVDTVPTANLPPIAAALAPDK